MAGGWRSLPHRAMSQLSTRTAKIRSPRNEHDGNSQSLISRRIVHAGGDHRLKPGKIVGNAQITDRG